MNATTTNGSDALAAARASWQAALTNIGATVRLLESELLEAQAAQADLQRLGVIARGYPLILERAIQQQAAAWKTTAEGCAALGVPPPPTRAEELLAAARFDLQSAEENLARAKAVQPLTEGMVDDRKKHIEAAAAAVIVARRRVADLDPSDGAAFVAWLKAFGLEVRKVLSNPPVVPRSGAALAAFDEADLAEARRADPLGALLADMAQR